MSLVSFAKKKYTLKTPKVVKLEVSSTIKRKIQPQKQKEEKKRKKVSPYTTLTSGNIPIL